jgi:hypothetical protein
MFENGHIPHEKKLNTPGAKNREKVYIFPDKNPTQCSFIPWPDE